MRLPSFHLSLSLLTLTHLSTANPLSPRQYTPCPVVQAGDYIWKISSFYARKPDGISISALGFNVEATNGGTANFSCSVMSAEFVEEAVFYQCGDNSFIFFAWQDDRAGLVLRQDVADDFSYVGTTTLPNYCRAGGNGPRDYVCQGVSDAYITMVQYLDTVE